MHKAEIPAAPKEKSITGKKRDSRQTARMEQAQRVSEIGKKTRQECADASLLLVTQVQDGKRVRRCGNKWCRQPNHTKANCTTPQPNTATVGAGSETLSTFISSSADHGRYDGDGNSIYFSDEDDDNRDDYNKNFSNEDDDDNRDDDNNNVSMKVIEIADGGASANKSSQNEIEVQRAPLEPGTRVRLRSYVVGTDPEFLNFPLKLHGVIIPHSEVTSRATVFNLRWFTGLSGPLFYEPAISYNAVRLYSITRLDHGEDGY